MSDCYTDAEQIMTTLPCRWDSPVSKGKLQNIPGLLLKKDFCQPITQLNALGG